MEHAGISTRLMMGQLGFLFENDDPLARIRLHDAIGRGQADDSPADDQNICLLHGSLGFFPSVALGDAGELAVADDSGVLVIQLF